MKKTMNLDDMLLLYNITRTKDTERVVSAIFSFLNYLPSGITLEVPNISIHKLSNDVMSINASVNKEEMMDQLAGIRVIKLPV